MEIYWGGMSNTLKTVGGGTFRHSIKVTYFQFLKSSFSWRLTFDSIISRWDRLINKKKPIKFTI